MAIGMLVVPTETSWLNRATASGKKIADAHPDRHRQEDPQGQETVEEGKALEGVGFRWHGFLLSGLLLEQSDQDVLDIGPQGQEKPG